MGRLLDAECQALIKTLEQKGWEIGPNTQLQVIRFIKHYAHQHFVTKDQIDKLGGLARTSYLKVNGNTAKRWKTLFTLGTDQDRIRALTQGAHRRHQPVRYSGEELYPTEGWIGTYLNWCQGSEVPLGYHFWAAVGLIGAACKRRVWINRRSFDTYMNEAYILVMETGGKKSQAIRTALSMATSLNNQLLELQRIRWSEVGILPWEDPTMRFIANDCTPEALIRDLAVIQINPVLMTEGVTVTMENQEAIGIIPLFEMGSMFNKDNFNIGKAIDNTIYLLDGPPVFESSRVGRKGDDPRNVCLSFWAATTPDWIRTNFTKSHLHGGFGSRFKFIYRTGTERCFPDPDPLDAIWREELAQQLQRFCLTPKHIMERTHEATQWYEDWYRTTLKDQKEVCESEMRGWFQRKDDHVLRLAAVLAMSEGEDYHITVDHCQMALEIIEDEEARMPSCFAAIGAHPEAENMERVYKLMPKQAPVQRGYLTRRLHCTSEQTTRWLIGLRDMGRVRRAFHPPGRGEWWERVYDTPTDDVTH